MIMIMSPAKTFRADQIKSHHDVTPDFFTEKTQQLLTLLKKYSVEELCTLMKMSEALGVQNYDRYQNFEQQENIQALYAFEGEAYKGLDAKTLSDEAVNFSEKHLIILCGLYGILTPMMNLKPYRLEMATKLSIDDYKDLVQFWRQELTQHMIEYLQTTDGDQVLLNLASTEYSKALNLKDIQKKFRVVTVEFKECKGDTYKVVGMYAKKARGQMVRYILENQINYIEEIKSFKEDGYGMNDTLSSEDIWIFTR